MNRYKCEMVQRASNLRSEADEAANLLAFTQDIPAVNSQIAWNLTLFKVTCRFKRTSDHYQNRKWRSVVVLVLLVLVLVQNLSFFQPGPVRPETSCDCWETCRSEWSHCGSAVFRDSCFCLFHLFWFKINTNDLLNFTGDKYTFTVIVIIVYTFL